MARKKKFDKKPIEQYGYKGKKRDNSLAAGDTLLAVNALFEKEPMAGRIVNGGDIEGLKIREVK